MRTAARATKTWTLDAVLAEPYCASPFVAVRRPSTARTRRGATCLTYQTRAWAPFASKSPGPSMDAEEAEYVDAISVQDFSSRARS